jgi:predicted phage-related endonuclease
MSDFDPEFRRKFIWATDMSQEAKGEGVRMILEKQGKVEAPDLSGIEAVQMGHVMQGPVGVLAARELGCELEPEDSYAIHSKYPFMASHTDFRGDGFLVECKNLSAFSTKLFDKDQLIVPAYYRAQCLHEAACWGVDRVVMAVLFGGQHFETFDLRFTPEQLDEHCKRVATLWGHVVAGTIPEPRSVEDCKLAYSVSNPSVAIATQAVERAVQSLKTIKDDIKRLESAEADLQAQILAWMGRHEALTTVGDEVLATWKSSKPSKKFDAKLFQTAMPDVYSQFIVEQPGSRRFLIK